MTPSPRFQLTPDQYHELAAYQAHMLMQTQWALAVKERELALVRAELLELKQRASGTENPAGAA